jgi:integrase
LRRGELLALRWRALDLDRGILSVRETLEQTRDGLRFKQPKTAKSRRTVDLPTIAIAELRRHKTELAKSRLSLGPAFQDHDLVFPEPDGRPWAPDKFSSAFAALARRTGFSGFRFHDLRHTHATQLLGEGIHPKIVSERLGHATVAITLDT